MHHRSRTSEQIKFGSVSVSSFWLHAFAVIQIMFFSRTFCFFLNLTARGKPLRNESPSMIYVQTFMMLNMMLPKSLRRRSKRISKYCKKKLKIKISWDEFANSYAIVNESALHRKLLF